MQQAVARATEYLKTAKTSRVGAEALLGLALIKAGVSHDHPRVVSALNVVRKEVNRSEYSFGELYTPAAFVAFLVELDDVQYRTEIQKMISYLEASIRPYGGWGYPAGHDHDDTADTSMTQYVMLAMWEAHRSGIRISPHVIEKTVLWLSKTQDPGGGFGYQGKLPSGNELVPQSRVSVSLTTAGLCATYLAEDMFGMLQRESKEDDGLPPGLTRVSDSKQENLKTNLAPGIFRNIQGRNNAWLEKKLTFNITYYQYYFAYIYERYWSLREYGGDRASGDWYTWIARNLLDTQKEDGCWDGHLGATVETCLSVLCLVRSMKRSIEKDRTYGTGNLVGGRGLPKDSDLVKIRDGKVVSQGEATALDILLKDVTKSKDGEYAKAIGQLDDLPPDEAKVYVSKQAARLRDMAGGTSADDRLVAVKALAQAGSLDDVPTLIYVLTDPEPEIVLAARDGLRRISRKIHGFGMPDDFEEKDRQQAINHWKAWFLAIRPDAEFEN